MSAHADESAHVSAIRTLRAQPKGQRSSDAGAGAPSAGARARERRCMRGDPWRSVRASPADRWPPVNLVNRCRVGRKQAGGYAPSAHASSATALAMLACWRGRSDRCSRCGGRRSAIRGRAPRAHGARNAGHSLGDGVHVAAHFGHITV